MADEVKENNKQLVCEIKIDAEMMRKIIDEKMTQIELDIQEIRNKAIDEFAERMKEKWIESDDLSISSEFFDFVEEIAEEMKAGGENEID